jgi:hypothetical protein
MPVTAKIQSGFNLSVASGASISPPGNPLQFGSGGLNVAHVQSSDVRLETKSIPVVLIG